MRPAEYISALKPIDSILAVPAVRALRLPDGSTFGDVADKLQRVRAGGPTSGNQLIDQWMSAARSWHDTNGGMITDLLVTRDANQQRVAQTLLELGKRARLDTSPAGIAEMERTLASDERLAWAGTANGGLDPVTRKAVGIVALAPEISSALFDGRSGPKAIYDRAFATSISIHELEHLVTPLNNAADFGLGWLEEGAATLLSMRSNAVGEFSAAMGQHVPDLVAIRRAVLKRTNPAHAGWSDTIRGVLDLAGVDGYKKADAARTRTLLQGPALIAVPIALAQAIVDARQLAADQVDVISDEITRLDGDKDRLKALRTRIEALPKQP